MTPAGATLTQRLAELRRTFDERFAVPPPGQAPQREDLLLVRVAATPYALRLAQIAGVFVDQATVPLPSPVPELIGVAAFRGALVPVYDLGLLLGHPPAGNRWLVLTGPAPQVAFAFDGIDGHRRVESGDIAAAPQRAGSLGGVAHLAGEVRPVVDLPAVRAGIAARAATHRSDRETTDGTS